MPKQQHQHQPQPTTNSSTAISNPDSQPKSEPIKCSDPERGWIFHRNREQPAPHPDDPPIARLKFYLDRYKIKEALCIFFNDQTLKLLRDEPDFMWDVIPLICKRLRGLCQYRFRVFEGCEKMLCRIAVDEHCKPKEVLISLLAEIGQHGQCDDDNVFRALIRPLEGTLLRMTKPIPRDENFRWVLDALVRHITDIELPQEYNLEGRKRLALPNDPSVKRFIEVLPLILSFIEEFNDRPVDFDKTTMPVLTESQIDELFNGELNDDDLVNDQSSTRGDSLDASITALMSLMHRPLSYLDLTSCCAEFKLIGNKCLTTLLKLQPNLFSPIYKRICDKQDELDQDQTLGLDGSFHESILSLATCAYIYRCERSAIVESIQYFPLVLTHESLLFCHLLHIVGLMAKSEIIVQEKGLLLLDSLLKFINPDSLDRKFLDMFETSLLFEHLFRIMVYSPLCTNRRKAYDMFTCLCDLLTHDCKLKLFKDVLEQQDLRPCVRAACIDQYRKHLTIIYRELMNLHQNLSVISPNSQPSNLPTDQPLVDEETAIQYASNLQDDPVTDLTNHSDSVEETNSSVANLTLAIKNRMKQLHMQYKSIGSVNLVEFLESCIKICLPDSQHTDIIENYELLLATLTMFRFLKLRKNLIKDEIEEEYLSGKRLKRTFFDPIRDAMSTIMKELKIQHEDVVEKHRKKNKLAQNSIMNVTQSRDEYDLLSRILGPKLDEFIDPKDIPCLDEQDEAYCLNWALCRFDLVESVLFRTCDLYGC